MCYPSIILDKVREIEKTNAILKPYRTSDGVWHDINPSHALMSFLPDSLPIGHPFNPTDCVIKIMNPTRGEGNYIKTEWSHVREYISQLHDEHHDDIDLFLHCASWRKEYVSVEERAYREDFSSNWQGNEARMEYYWKEDAYGKFARDTPKLAWAKDIPMGLSSGLPFADIVNHAMMMINEQTETIPAEPVKTSPDAQDFVCGFEHYESLANKYIKNTRGQVMFCHIPIYSDDKRLEKINNTILAVIGSACPKLKQGEVL